MLTILEQLRTEIDTVDRLMVSSLSADPALHVKPPEIIGFSKTETEKICGIRLHYSHITWQLLHERNIIAAKIGKAKKESGLSSAIDEERKRAMIESRVSWAPEDRKRNIGEFYEIIHDVSVRIQEAIMKT